MENLKRQAPNLEQDVVKTKQPFDSGWTFYSEEELNNRWKARWEIGDIREPTTDRLPQEIVDRVKPKNFNSCESPIIKPDERFYQASYNGKLLRDVYVSQYSHVIRKCGKDHDWHFVQPQSYKPDKPHYLVIVDVYTMDGERVHRARVHRLVAETWLQKPLYLGYKLRGSGSDVQIIAEYARPTLHVHHMIKGSQYETKEDLPEDYNYAVNLVWTYQAIHDSITEITKRFIVVDNGIFREFLTTKELAKYFNVSEGLIEINLGLKKPRDGERVQWYHFPVYEPHADVTQVKPDDLKMVSFWMELNVKES